MTTSEPTTGEIVRALRCDGDANNCVDCRYATYDTATILCDQEQNGRDAADRLESQEREIERLREAKHDWKREVTNPTHADFARVYRELAERKMNANGIVCVDTAMIHQAASIIESQMIELSELPALLKALTVRAEQVERERDAAVADLSTCGECDVCKHWHFTDDEYLTNCDVKGCSFGSEFEWRGQPQDGEGL